MYPEKILRRTSALMPYTTLFTAKEASYFEKYFASLILWLQAHYHNDMKIMSSAKPVKSVLMLFYANHGKTVPQEEMALSIPSDVSLSALVEKMRQESISYLILIDTDNFASTMTHLLPLWENPALASELGLILLHVDPAGAQVYMLQQ
jgi:hypothetical protein